MAAYTLERQHSPNQSSRAHYGYPAEPTGITVTTSPDRTWIRHRGSVRAEASLRHRTHPRRSHMGPMCGSSA